MEAFLSRLNFPERAVIAVSSVLLTFLIVDPLVFQAVSRLDAETRNLFRSFTDLGKAGWILIPLGIAIIGLYLFRIRDFRFRLRVASGYLMQLLGFLFLAVAGASLAGGLIKNILGRARPKFFDTFGSIEFQPFTFESDFASFPSGHSTTIFALAASLAIMLPRWRVFLFTAAAWVAATRFLVGAHYFSDTIGGAMLGLAFPYFLRGRLAERRWLFEKRKDGQVRLRGTRLWPRIGAQARKNAISGPIIG